MFIAITSLHDLDFLKMIQLALGYPNGFSLVVKNALQEKLNFLNKLVDLYFLRKEFQCTHSYHQLRSFMKLMCPAVIIDLLQFSFLAASAHPLLPSNGYPLIAPIGVHLINHGPSFLQHPATYVTAGFVGDCPSRKRQEGMGGGGAALKVMRM